MQRSHFKRDFTTTFIGILVLLLGATLGVAQQAVNLTAAPTSATLPDGSVVPMWGYSCDVSQPSPTNATCAALSKNPTGWSPVIITVPSGQDLQINLTNALTFQPPTPSGGSAPAANTVPTSLVIVGQLGGGLGNSATSNPSPTHNNLSTTWPIASTGPEFVPPSQPNRVQSFATEVTVAGGQTSLTWKAPRPGTYLLESGTHPSIQVPMGLYGMVVVSAAPTSSSAGTAYPNVSYGADVPVLFSEIDATQNRSVTAAVTTAGFSEAATLGPFKAQPLSAISVVNGGHDYTSQPTVTVSAAGCTTVGGGTCPATATATIDTTAGSPTLGQVTAITVTNTANYTSSPTVVISGGLGCTATPSNPCASADAVSQLFTSTYCSGGASACYPAAVNYTPMYYLVNGQAFDKTNPGNSLFAVNQGTSTGPVTGNVLVRMVNAGLKMHVPSIVGSQTGASAANGLSLIAEDGNPLPGVTRVQNEVFMAAGKTYDVMINGQFTPPGTATTPAPYANALPIFDRELSLSGMSTNRDSGMLAYIGINSAGAPSAGSLAGAAAYPDSYVVVPGKTLTISDISKGVIANDVNVFGVQISATATPAAHGVVSLNNNGTFTYTPDASWTPSSTFTDTFGYCANGGTTACATVTLSLANLEAATGITCFASNYTASNAVYLSIKTPGVLANCKDAAGYPLTVDTTTIVPTGGLSVVADANGGFTATAPAAGPYTFTFVPVNSQGTRYSGTVTANLTFPTGSGLQVTVLDGADHKTHITDYRWIIEEDRTFYMDPACTTNPLPAGCPTVNAAGTPPVFGTNFHTSFMPVVATGCTGALSCESGQSVGGTPVVCDQGDGVCRTDAASKTAVDPSQVVLDPTKRYYISVLPGDAANPFNTAYGSAPVCQFTTDPITQLQVSTPTSTCGHGMGGAPIAKNQNAVTVLTEPSPYPPAKLTVFVFQDDNPLNGEHDAGGGVDTLAPNEPGLGGFEITIADDAGGTGDATGQPTYDMFNQPLTNSLAGTIDPITNLDACPISTQATTNGTTGDGSQKGIVGMVVTCPYFESDGVTLSPLAGQAIVPNLYPGRYGIIANPGADRIARGEEWLQTNTLDGQKAHDSFMRIGEPAYFQEFGPAGYHVTIGFANPQIINGRLASVCGAGTSCNNTLKARVTTARMSRTPDERLYSSGSRDEFGFTQCYASLGDPDGENFAFAKCNNDGTFTMSGLPAGNWRLVIFDQWNDQIVDGIATPVALNCSVTTSGACSGTSSSGGINLNIGDIATHQWQANIYTRSFIDLDKNGVSTKDSSGNDTEPGLALVPTNVRYRDGSFSNINNTDLNGYANFNEVFPLFNWYVIETDQARYKTTGVHVVYDVGGPTDGTTGGGNSNIGHFFANTLEKMPLPSDLRIPGAVYCDAATQNADCTGASIATGPLTGQPSGPLCTLSPNSDGHGGTVSCAQPMSSGRIDPPLWFGSYGWQGFSGQSNFLEFGKTPYVPGETGGIRGHVVYASTRPFDDPQFLLQNTWEPLVPHVTVNLYKESTAPDGTQSLALIDTTQTSSFDDWAQGFRADGRTPNISCPGELPAAQTAAGPADPFWFGLENQPNYLDWYNSQHGGPSPKVLPYQSQFKCYDGMHQWNQLQPAPYDGMYSFPSVISFDPTTGKPNGTNCTACTTDPDSSDPYRSGIPMLPAGKYVVEVVVPPGYDLVKEEDKNILIGDNYIAPVTSQFAGFGSIFILPDQAAIGAAYNSNNPQNQTQGLGVSPMGGNDATKTQEYVWPCVGELRTVPDFISLFPQSGEVSPFAGATRHLCNRKEITLDDQSSAQAKFFIFTPTHAASHFTGVILDDFTAEFDPYSPQFGEKFAPSYLPVSLKDWAGNEVNRVYADMFGLYNGLNYSTWEVNPPNPTGYAPTMMVTCMNDPGTGATPDPLYQPNYSDFCYELAYMPGQTGYFDTPVTPTSAFSEGYNHPDCNYPDQTPAISQVTSQDIAGPWVSAAGHTITITSLPDQMVDNYGYVGPSATATPFNQQKVPRHYGFGSQCTSPAANSLTCNTLSAVTIGGVPATITSWLDNEIKIQVPSGVPACAIQQQAQYGGSTAQCGQLVITAGNGHQSVDTVTVTIGGNTPTLLISGQTIQSALDAANPGDMIIVPPGNYNELLIMWKPVRLQGVGAASSVVNANTHPAGKLDPWRTQIVCLFGLTADGRPSSGPYAGCPGSGWKNLPTANAAFPSMIVDRVTLEAVLGWDANLNGNLAEQLIEPSLMGAYEGAAITVLGKGVNIPKGSADPFGSAAATAASFPTGTVLLTAADCTDPTGANPYPSNFYCNPSSIDGLTLTNSSQGGGGIFVHAWGHNLQIANNRVKNNSGTMSGGITVGQGEHIDVLLGGAAPLDPPNSCESGVANQGLPFCYDVNVNVHNNSVTLNTSLGDELFSSTPAGAGGVTFCNGADYYKFNYNWVCGNMSTGDGGGFAHVGFIKNGDIEHNSFLFNQSQNPTITTNGGGVLVMGAPDADPPCGILTDKDCLASPSSILPSNGTGPGLVINANMIIGNSADAGSGGGLRLQQVNGTDVLNSPNGQTACPTVGAASCLWNSVTVTNNIISNNVAGWDGAGVSLQDAMAVNIVNNTIVSNDSTASSGTLFGSLFAPLASNPGVNCTTPDGTYSCPQVAGLVSTMHSPVLSANLALLPPNSITCPSGHANCASISDPLLANNLIWQNRSFVIGVGGPGSASTGKNQQNVVTLYNAAFPTSGSNAVTPTSTPGSQGSTGQCITGSSYWDIGVRNDLGPALHNSGFSLSPTYSVLTDASDYTTGNNLDLGANPNLESQYCNGSRVPPENGGPGYTVYPGTNETSGGPTWLWAFNLTPSATVDEGNNWINMRWGPLSLTHPVTGKVLGKYALAVGSPAIDYVPVASPAGQVAPTQDFFGNPRPDPGVLNKIDVGAVELQIAVKPPTLAAIAPPAGLQGTVVNVTLTGTNLLATTSVNVPAGSGITVSNLNLVSDTSLTATFTIAATAVGPVNVSVTNPAGTSGNVTFQVLAPTVNSITPASGARGYSVAVTLAGVNLTGATAINVPVGSGITVAGFTPVSDIQVNAIFAIAKTAALNADSVTVSVGAATSNPITFTVVNPPAPTLTSITPARAAKRATGSTTVPVTLSGTNLLTASALNVSGTGVTSGPITVLNDTTVTATLTITNAAATGDRSVTITTLGGTSNVVTFTVARTPNLTSIAPNTGARGQAVSVTLTGTGLTGTTAVTVSGTGVTVSGINVVSDTSVTATFTIAANAALTARIVTVNVGTAVSNGIGFTVVNAVTPTLSSIAPNTGLRGAAVPVTLTGTGLTGATTLTFPGGAGGITVSALTPVNDTTVTATLNISATAGLGTRNVSITTPGGASNTVTFTVQGPTLSSIAPTQGARGTSVSVTLTGVGLTGATGLNFPGGAGGITVSAFTPVNDTTVTATLNIPASGTGNIARNVRVATPIGNTNTVTFTVVNPPAPTLGSITPNTGLRGTAVPVTITGNNFTATGTTVTVPGGGISVSGVTVVSATQIMATFTIGNAAGLGNRNVSVSTPGGPSNTVTFTVQGPTLTGIIPTVGTHGTTVGVAISGSNLAGATAVTISGGGITCTGVTATASSVSSNCTITNGATRNARNVTVATPIGNATLTAAFTVQ